MSPPDIASQRPARIRRSRAYHRPVKLWFASLLLLIAFLSIAAFGALAVTMAVTGDRLFGAMSLVGLGGFVIARGAAFILSQRLHCPLCHGAVLSEKRCRKHAAAVRIPLMSYRAMVVLSALCTLAFRCMYCGTRFRLRR